MLPFGAILYSVLSKQKFFATHDSVLLQFCPLCGWHIKVVGVLTEEYSVAFIIMEAAAEMNVVCPRLQRESVAELVLCFREIYFQS